MTRKSLTRFAWLSIAAALVTIVLKAVAFWLTGSVGLLSDALESIVNLVGGFVALAMLSVAARPADEDHAYGHGKAEYFASGVEGSLILVAAASIGAAAIHRLCHPQALSQVGAGILVSAASSLVNLAVGLLLLRVGRAERSITLEANAQHLLTDVWTSVGVLVGVAGVVATGWLWLDPVVALLVAFNIVWTGSKIVWRSIFGLMDPALPPEERARIEAVLNGYRTDEIQFHALRTRQGGARRFVSVHVLVPGAWTVHDGHELVERIEADIRSALPSSYVFTHLESLDDPASWEDEVLERDGF
ncbi:MAG: cation diffusion facilitator family transporter [Akkermansiaceae bacterium]|nr:cation diffusion facilitator family transporter [Akkermansiaceae bacterium]